MCLVHIPVYVKKEQRIKLDLLEAFEDKDTKGYNWNNPMLQRWVDPEGEEHRVLDDYNRNVTLCDLSAQPDNVKELINNTISTVETKNITQVGMRLLKFCAKWDMQRISDQAAQYAQPYRRGIKMIKAKEVLKDKFRIVEEHGQNVANIFWDKENYIVNQKGVTSLFQTQSQISEKLGKKIF